MSKRYEPLAKERHAARLRWRARHGGRGGARGPNFPPELAEYPEFHVWLRGEVELEAREGVDVDPLLSATSHFPSRRAKKYRSMYCHGYHLRVQSAETHLRTCDSGVAGTFIRSCRSGTSDTNQVLAPVEYVGKLDEILELDYGYFNQIMGSLMGSR